MRELPKFTIAQKMSAYPSIRPKESNPEERLSVIKQGCVSVGFMVICYVIGYYVMPFPVPALPTPISRLLYTLQWQVVPAYLLFAGIGTVALTRFLTPAINPLNASSDHIITVHVRYVQNTLEQFVLSAIGQLMISIYLDDRQMKLIPVLVFLFVVGRITFWIGYTRFYLQRLFGMTLTVVPTMLLYVVLLHYFFIYGPMSMLWR